MVGSRTRLHPDFHDLAARVSSSPGAVELDGRPLPFDPADLPRSLSDAAWELYRRWYTRPGDAGDPALPQEAYEDALRRLGAGRDRWERGWEVKLRLDDGALLVEKQARRQWVHPGAYVLRNPHGRAEPGTQVDLFLPGAGESVQQGFVYLFGRVLSENDPVLDFLRFYLSFPPARMLELLGELVPALDGRFVPFRLKVLRHADDFARADSAVLYVEDRYAPLVRRLLADVAVPGGRPGPRMVAVLHPGVGMAEDPPGGASFGLTRCVTLAHGLSRLLERDRVDTRDVRAAIAAALRDDGVDAERPWLEPRSHRTSVAYRSWLGFPPARS
jgi:hypothetical protein